MVYAVIALLALPIILLVLWIVKVVLKLTFSLAKVLLVLVVIWFIFTAVTGGLSDVISNFNQPHITTESGGLTRYMRYMSAFSKSDFDITPYLTDRIVEMEMDCAFSEITIDLPDQVVVKIKAMGALTEIVDGDKKVLLPIGEKQFVVGSGSTILEIQINSAVTRVIFK